MKCNLISTLIYVALIPGQSQTLTGRMFVIAEIIFPIPSILFYVVYWCIYVTTRYFKFQYPIAASFLQR